jgi:hypothetical protein
MRGFRVEAVVFGSCLIVLGVAAFLATSGRPGVLDTLRRFWPVALLFWGVLELVNVRLIRSARGDA